MELTAQRARILLHWWSFRDDDYQPSAEESGLIASLQLIATSQQRGTSERLLGIRNELQYLLDAAAKEEPAQRELQKMTATSAALLDLLETLADAK